MISPNKFLLSELTFRYLMTPNMQFYTQELKLKFLAILSCRPPNPFHNNFLVKTNFLKLGCPYISYCKVKRLCWTFRENRCVDLSIVRWRNFSQLSRFLIRKFENPRGESDWILLMLIFYLASTGLGVFLFEKHAQRTWKPIFGRVVHEQI